MRTIYRSTVFDAPVATVWSIIRDFNDWPRWLPIIGSSEIEDGLPSNAVGCVRTLRLPPEGLARERLLALDDHTHTITYAVEETTSVAMRDYVATIRLHAVTDGDRTFAEWSGSFDAAPEDEPEIAQMVGTRVYESGLAGIRERLRALAAG